MTTTQLVLLSLHTLFGILCFMSVLERAQNSETARVLGKDTYVFNGLFLSLLPILNIPGTLAWFYSRFCKKTSKYDYYDLGREHREFEERRKRHMEFHRQQQLKDDERRRKWQQ